MPIPDWFGFPDPSTPKKLSAPTGFSDVHQDGMSWAKEGPTVDETTWIDAESWNRIIGNMRGLLAVSGVDVSDLAVNSNLLLRTFIIRAIAAILDGTDIEGAGVLMKSVYDPAATGKVALGAGGTGVAATDLADLRTKIGVTAAITALSDSVTSALADKLARDGSNFADEAEKQQFRTALGVVPAGSVISFAMNTAPTGWLKANGAAVSRTTYVSLFAAIGTAFGVGDGSTTFNLPDARGEFIRGWDDGRGVDSGRVFGSWQADEYKDHQHQETAGYASPFGTGQSRSTALHNDGVTTSANLTSLASYVSGNGGGSETRSRNLAFLTCIKY
jgi:microcystin-dependent protein